MATNYIQPGDVLTLTAPAGGVVAGTGYVIGELFVVALSSALVGADFQGQLVGVWQLAKTSTQVWAKGDRIFYDNANKRCDSDPSKGPAIGVATEAAVNPSSTGVVRLDGIGGAGGVSAALEGTPAPTSINTAGAVTYTAAQILSGVIVRDPNGAARTDVLPTAALLVAALPGAEVGDMIKCYIVNGADAAEALTIGEGVGGAFDANQQAASRIIGQNNSKLLHIRLTNVTAAAEAYVAYL